MAAMHSTPASRPGAAPASSAPGDSVDVAIVGGGLVGASLAIALDALGLDVAMLEATPGGELPAVFDERNLSLAEASVNALTALGVWPLLQAASGPIRQVHVSRVGDFGRVLLKAGEQGREAFGQVVMARDFGQALEARLQQLPRLRRLRPARFVGTTLAADGVRDVQFDDAEGRRQLRTRLLVAADGADSSVRAALGINADIEDYRQVVLVSRVRGERRPDGTAFERLTDHGPIALLPRGDGHFGLVHGVPADDADAFAGMDDADYLQHVQQAFGWRAGRLLSVGPRSRYPMRRVLAQRLTAPRAVLVGNAAQAMHPIGAQGFNLGLRDALVLAELLAERGIDDALVDAYAARRSEDRARTLAFSDGLARFSANPTALASVLRSLGMAGIAGSGSLQSWLVGGAMGYRGQVPRLCRGGSA